VRLDGQQLLLILLVWLSQIVNFIQKTLTLITIYLLSNLLIAQMVLIMALVVMEVVSLIPGSSTRMLV